MDYLAIVHRIDISSTIKLIPGRLLSSRAYFRLGAMHKVATSGSGRCYRSPFVGPVVPDHSAHAMHELVAHCIDHQDRLLAFSTLALEVLAQFTGFAHTYQRGHVQQGLERLISLMRHLGAATHAAA